jgi:hypothetical protein
MNPPTCLKLLLSVFNLSLRDLEKASGKSVSRSSIHRIITGAKPPSPFERQHITAAVVECLKGRCDSGFLWR